MKDVLGFSESYKDFIMSKADIIYAFSHDLW